MPLKTMAYGIMCSCLEQACVIKLLVAEKCENGRMIFFIMALNQVVFQQLYEGRFYHMIKLYIY